MHDSKHRPCNQHHNHATQLSSQLDFEALLSTCSRFTCSSGNKGRHMYANLLSMWCQPQVKRQMLISVVNSEGNCTNTLSKCFSREHAFALGPKLLASMLLYNRAAPTKAEREQDTAIVQQKALRVSRVAHSYARETSCLALAQSLALTGLFYLLQGGMAKQLPTTATAESSEAIFLFTNTLPFS